MARKAAPRRNRGGQYRRKHTKESLTEKGIADGTRDAQAVSSCPPGYPLGPDPEVDWSYFYHQAYDAIMASAQPHGTCPRCEGKNGSE